LKSKIFMVRVEDEVVEGRVVERQLVGVKDDGPNAAAVDAAKAKIRAVRITIVARFSFR